MQGNYSVNTRPGPSVCAQCAQTIATGEEHFRPQGDASTRIHKACVEGWESRSEDWEARERAEAEKAAAMTDDQLEQLSAGGVGAHGEMAVMDEIVRRWQQARERLSSREAVVSMVGVTSKDPLALEMNEVGVYRVEPPGGGSEARGTGPGAYYVRWLSLGAAGWIVEMDVVGHPRAGMRPTYVPRPA